MHAAKALSLALLAVLAREGAAQAQAIQPPGGGKIFQPSPASVIVPSSSVLQAKDFGVAAHTNTKFIKPEVFTSQLAIAPLTGPPFAGQGFETPGSLACLYGLVTPTAGCNPNSALTVSAKGSKAIAIVDAYHYATAVHDLQIYSTQFGLPAANLKIFKATAAGACTGPTPIADSGWEGEAALDLQMAHGLAPNAALFLVEAQSASDTDLLGAVKCASTLVFLSGGGEVSMSWGGAEFAGQVANDTYFSQPSIVYFASSGDAPGVSWPATSAKVVSVGGASVSRSLPSLNFSHFSSWADAGGGPSTIVPRPAYQNAIQPIVGSWRGSPDISAVANPATGVWVYDSNPVTGTGWYVFGGTSVASPVVAAIVNAAGTFRANTAAELTAIYAAKAVSATADFAIPTTGYCGPYASYTVVPAYNYCSGVGTPKAAVAPLSAQR